VQRAGAEPSTPLLWVQDVHKRFGGVHALRGVHLDVRAGEVHALVGENGAGKSTIINILAGAVQRDSGRVTFGGADIAFASPAESQAVGIAVIHQELATLPTLSVAENVCMGRLPVRGWWLDRRTMRERTRTLLAEVGLDVPVDARVSELSLSQQQLVEIAKALGAGAKLLVMDEPTASLTTHEALRLHALVRRLRDQGTAILFVSHRLSEVFAISDRITVFRDGAYVATMDTPAASPTQIVELMVGRAMSHVQGFASPSVDAPIVLEVRGLTRRSPGGRALGLSRVNLTVRRGEVVGLAGLVGAGRSEVARAVFGEDDFDEGEVLLDGAPVRFRSPADALRAGIAMVPEDRKGLALFLEQSVRSNMSISVLPKLRRGRLVSRRAERALADDYVGRLRVATPDIETPVSALSGGNQQKTVLARWLATKPRLLILDEPTHGVDVGAKAEIHALIRRLAGEGVAILLISSELPEVLALSSRIVVMREGRVAADLSRTEADERVVMLHATGGVNTSLVTQGQS
jgi:ABC-type sugar transport system ATPase subunit